MNPNEPASLTAGYRFQVGHLTIVVRSGDLLFTSSDLLVCPCLSGDRHQGGLPMQILKAGGEGLSRELQSKSEQLVPFTTGSHRLAMRKIKAVYHLQLHGNGVQSVLSALTGLFTYISEKSIPTVSLNSLNAAILKIPYKRLAHQLADAIREVPVQHPVQLFIIDSNPTFLKSLEEVFHANQ